MTRLASERRRVWPLAAVLALRISATGAVEPDEVLADAQLEQRARAISRELRCMVCQNESIDDSHAPLARDLRLIVRERLKQGASDADIFNDLTRRYGDFVLLRPRFAMHTLLLWLAPFAVLLCGAAVIAFALKRQAPGEDETLPWSGVEEQELARLLADDNKHAALPKRNLPESPA